MHNESNTSRNIPEWAADGLPARVIRFSRFLRRRGFKVFSSSVIDSLKGLEQADISAKEDFFSILRANLASTDMEWRLFPELFKGFWGLDDVNEKGDENPKERKNDADPRKDLLQEVLVQGEEG
ncbi:MAG: hypothetical protein CVU64_00570, partial [Deltaproteobacteria bacterium HGW-Deltaproteobacteria-21]